MKVHIVLALVLTIAVYLLQPMASFVFSTINDISIGWLTRGRIKREFKLDAHRKEVKDELIRIAGFPNEIKSVQTQLLKLLDTANMLLVLARAGGTEPNTEKLLAQQIGGIKQSLAKLSGQLPEMTSFTLRTFKYDAKPSEANSEEG